MTDTGNGIGSEVHTRFGTMLDYTKEGTYPKNGPEYEAGAPQNHNFGGQLETFQLSDAPGYNNPEHEDSSHFGPVQILGSTHKEDNSVFNDNYLPQYKDPDRQHAGVEFGHGIMFGMEDAQGGGNLIVGEDGGFYQDDEAGQIQTFNGDGNNVNFLVDSSMQMGLNQGAAQHQTQYGNVQDRPSVVENDVLETSSLEDEYPVSIDYESDFNKKYTKMGDIGEKRSDSSSDPLDRMDHGNPVYFTGGPSPPSLGSSHSSNYNYGNNIHGYHPAPSFLSSVKKGFSNLGKMFGFGRSRPHNAWPPHNPSFQTPLDPSIKSIHDPAFHSQHGAVPSPHDPSVKSIHDPAFHSQHGAALSPHDPSLKSLHNPAFHLGHDDAFHSHHNHTLAHVDRYVYQRRPFHLDRKVIIMSLIFFASLVMWSLSAQNFGRDSRRKAQAKTGDQDERAR